MRRFLPTSRRLRTLAVAGTIGVLAAAAFASPAAACAGELGGDVTCVEANATTAVLTWTLHNKTSHAANITDFGAKSGTGPGNGEATTVSGEIQNGSLPGNATWTSTKTVPLGTWVKVSLRVNGETLTKKLDAPTEWAPGKCPPAPPVSPTSKSPSPSKSSSGVAGNSSSAGSGTLPVTGANSGLLAGGAILLVGAGVALFIVARRRRIKFTA